METKHPNKKRFYEVQTSDEHAYPLQYCTISTEVINSWRNLWDKSIDALTDGAVHVAWHITPGLVFFDGVQDGEYAIDYDAPADVQEFCELWIFGKQMEVRFSGDYTGEFCVVLDVPKGWMV